MLDQIRAIIDHNLIENTDQPNRFHYFESLMGTPAATGAANAYLMANPVARFPVYLDRQRLLNVRSNWARNMSFPTRAQLDVITGNTQGLTIAGVLGFFSGNTYLPWFVNVTTTMSYYARFFKDSRSLSSIITTGLGAGVIISNPHYTTQYFIDAPNAENAVPSNVRAADAANNIAAITVDTASAAAYYRPVPPTSLQCSISHSDRNCEEVAEQYGMLTAMNISSANSIVTSPPTDNDIREGVYWSLPALRQAGAVNPFYGFGPNIQANYLLSRPQ